MWRSMHAHPACIVIWCGDHKQTPGGLRKTDEAKTFRRKLLQRPIALRGDTEYIQPNMLGKVVLRHLEEVDDPVVNAIRVLLVELLGEARQLTSVVLLRSRLSVKKLDVNFIKSYASLSFVLLCLSCGLPCTERDPSFGRYPSSCSWCRSKVQADGARHCRHPSELISERSAAGIQLECPVGHAESRCIVPTASASLGI